MDAELGSPQHDGKFFGELLQVQKEKLEKLTLVSERFLEMDGNNIPDEQQGRIRSSVGQAKLMVQKKFLQFDKLCESNLNPKPGEMKILPTDLAGFWDLMMIEVNALFNEFRQLSDLARNSWAAPIEQEDTNVVKKKKPEQVKKSMDGKKALVGRKPSPVSKPQQKTEAGDTAKIAKPDSTPEGL